MNSPRPPAGHSAPIPVLFVHTATQPPLGADTWVQAQIIAHLDKATHEVHVACVPGPKDAPTPTFQALVELRDVNIHAVDFGPERSAGGLRQTLVGSLPAFSSALRLAKLIRARDVKFVHTTDRPRDALMSVLLAKITRTTSIVHVHVGYGEWMSHPLKWALRNADVLVPVSVFVGETLRDSGHRTERIHPVLNGIDLAYWTPGVGRAEIRKEFAIADDAPVILTACRLFPAKGPGELIKAVGRVVTRHPHVRLFVVGGEMVGGYRAELESLTKELGLEANVIFTGRRPDMPRLLAAADVFAMPSTEEPFGLVFAEAMAMKLPVVALDNGGTPEVVEHDVTGLLSSVGSLEQLAINLLALIEDPALRTRMGTAGRRRVEALFTTELQARNMAEVYLRLGSLRAVAG